MQSPIPLQCQCGLVRGQIQKLNSKGWNRFACLCDDCQTYALWLGKESVVLESDGGTEITPVTPSNFKITSGLDQIKCVQLSPKGLHRWYAGCCKTPLGNTPNASVPYIGVVHNFIYTEGKTREDLLGRMRGRVQGKFGKHPLKPGSSEGTPLNVMLAMIRFMIPAFVLGKKKPNPFYNDDGQPITTPTVLTKDERQSLRALTGSALRN